MRPRILLVDVLCFHTLDLSLKTASEPLHSQSRQPDNVEFLSVAGPLAG